MRNNKNKMQNYRFNLRTKGSHMVRRAPQPIASVAGPWLVTCPLTLLVKRTGQISTVYQRF